MPTETQQATTVPIAIKATITRISRVKYRDGTSRLQVECTHDDGSEWGGKIRDGIDINNPDRESLYGRWSILVDPTTDIDKQKQILYNDWSLIGMDIILSVVEAGKWYNIKSVSKSITEPVYESDDDIPF